MDSVAAAPATLPNDRVVTLDVLRGAALLGMLVVHVFDHSAPGAGWSAIVQRAVELFVASRAYATFAFLFGAGFAVQLARAARRGVPFAPRWLRRMAALLAFGLVAHAVFGYNVLIEYALWGTPLLLVRRWSSRTLLAVAIVTAFAWPLYHLTRGAIELGTIGRAASDASYAAWQQGARAAWDLLGRAQEQPTLLAALPYRARHMAWFYQQAWIFLPGTNLSLFLFGLLAVRDGLLVQPERHTRVLVTWMLLGVAMWSANWLQPFVPDVGSHRITTALRIWPRDEWLGFTYVGAVLLLWTRAPAARRWLRPLAVTGRAALSNYFAQIATLDLLLSRYALGLGTFPAWSILPLALGIYAALWLATRWWLTRFRYGPLEWLWRSATYGRLQPLRSAAPAPVATAPA